jgi:predicted nucleotidyltransferase
MREQGIRDYLLAKRKAAGRLGVSDRSSLPGNEEVEAALREQQRLFGGSRYEDRLTELRRTARQIMCIFEEFEPRLVGAVLTGAVTEHSDVNLHVFSDTPEAIAFKLMEQGIPYRLAERKVRYSADRTECLPAYRFAAGDVPVEVTVFPYTAMRQAPCCPVEGGPMRRASLADLADLSGD